MIQRLTSLAALILLFGVSSGLWSKPSPWVEPSWTRTCHCRGVCDGERLVRRHRHRPRRKICPDCGIRCDVGVFVHRIPPSEVTVANTVSDLKVELKPDVAGLEEAVVIGYGNQQRSKISGAVTTVDIKEATSIPVLRTEQALQGRAAGVQVTQNSRSARVDPDHPNSGFGLHQQLGPLFIVDGIPSGGIDYLNPSTSRASAS